MKVAFQTRLKKCPRQRLDADSFHAPAVGYIGGNAAASKGQTKRPISASSK